MSETADATVDSPAAAKATAVKDRNCPYCGQAFTSSSLGRHLDLYIKEKNPKPPDGLHDVDAIRKMRGAITRRQPRGSLAHRDASNPSPPLSATRRSPAPDSVIKPPAIPKEGQFVVDNQTAHYAFNLPWQVTGVINNIPTTNGAFGSGNVSSWEDPAPSSGDHSASTSRDPSSRIQSHSTQRVPSRAAQKLQLDARQKLSDAMDTARAAELALRELLSSMRAAKHNIDMNSLPFDFDPLALDFPALTLQCLQAPPTLFSSTPHPTSTSWSIEPPAQKQYEALQMHFENEFAKWRVQCASATTASSEDLTYPPNDDHFPRDIHEGIKKAEQNASMLEKQVKEHLQSTYTVWEQLTPQRRSELWGLELARSVGRRQKQLEKLADTQHLMKQENTHLKMQIEQLNMLQQPREFRTQPPSTIPIEDSLLVYMQGLGVKGAPSVGFSMDYRHMDLSTMVASAIGRWKNVIVSSRGTGMGSQKPLDQQITPTATPTTLTPGVVPPPQRKSVPHPKQKAVAAPALSAAPSTTAAAVSVANEDNSDLDQDADADGDADADADADADMDEGDTFTSLPMAVSRQPLQVHTQLEVLRTRGRNQRTTSARFMNVNGGKAREPTIRRSLPKLNAAASMVAHTQLQRNQVEGPGLGDVDPMYMD
ncbi:hypothetical protein F5Y16DRAFT_308663 [Xylariaceae sp. FL0255]|nr:hypothetical protein F5Y16DRAFT_308663 [Xylariaceae sp. FL0255]